MKTALHISALGPVLLGLVSFTTSAQAAGVDAGTLIQNTASATYTSGSGSGSVTSNTVTIKVDELLDVAVTGVDAAPISTGAGTSVLSYSLTNTGNGPEAFKLTANPSVSGNNFDTTIVSIVIDSNGNGSYDAGVDQVLAAGVATPLIAADASLKVFVIVSLPAGATDAQTSQVRLTADSATGTGTPGTVFAGQGEGGGDAVVGSSTASANALESVVASLATVSLSKSAVIADQFGGTQPVPGAVVTFTLTASVSGSGNADGLSITDAIPAGTTYQSGTLKLEGSALTDAADSDAGSGSSAGIAVGLGTVAGGSTRTVNFNVKIN